MSRHDTQLKETFERSSKGSLESEIESNFRLPAGLLTADFHIVAYSLAHYIWIIQQLQEQSTSLNLRFIHPTIKLTPNSRRE